MAKAGGAMAKAECGWIGDPAQAGAAPAVEECARVTARLATPVPTATPAGLPVRVPRAHLVPGSFDGDPPPPRRSPERVRSRLAAYTSGVREAQGASR